MPTEKLIRMTKKLFSDLEHMCDNLQKLLYTSAPAGPFPEPADPTMRSIFAILELGGERARLPTGFERPRTSSGVVQIRLSFVRYGGPPFLHYFSPTSAPFCSKMAPRLLQFWSVGVRSHLNFCFFAIVCSETSIFTMVTSRGAQSRRPFAKKFDLYTFVRF